MNPDPRIQELAKKTARKIRNLTDSHNAQLQQVYREYQEEASAIRGEVDTDSLSRSGVSSAPGSNPQHTSKD